MKGRNLRRGDNQLAYAKVEEIERVVANAGTDIDDDDVGFQRTQLP